MSERSQFDTVLITGIRGSGGSYLAEHIVHNHPAVKVHGIARWRSTTGPSNLGEVATEVILRER